MWHHGAAPFHSYPTYHAYGATHAPGFIPAGGHALGWFGHSIISAVIHGLIYSLIFRLFRNMSWTDVVVCTVVGLGLAGLIYYWFTHRERRRYSD